MKVCYVSSILNIHDFRFFEKFVEKGYDVHVVSFGEHNVKLDQRMRFYHFPLKKLLNLPKAVVFLEKILRKVRPDILHGGFIQMDGFVCALSNYHPFILMPWGSDVLLYPKESILMKTIAMYTIRRADMITCDAEFVRDETVRMGRYPANKTVVFPWGVDLRKFHPNSDGSETRKKLGWEDKRIIIMTRNLEPKYGIETFLKVLPKVVKEIPDVRILLCGKGPLMDQLIQYVKIHALDKYVLFTGFISNDDLPRYLCAADIYLSTSLTDGTSVSLLEAMACGLPAIVTDNPSIMEWIKDGENGLVVSKNDPIELTEKLIFLLENEALIRRFGERNLQIAKARADWDKNFEKLERMYEIVQGIK